MNLVLLSGGSGKRLWPLSGERCAKQFLKLLKNGDTDESMLQRVYRQIRAADPCGTVTIAASHEQADMIRQQLGNDVRICEEPCKRDTFPAIALAGLYLRDVCGLCDNEPVVVCPVDSLADDLYFRTLLRFSDLVANSNANLSLMGIEPDSPSNKFGYIIPVENSEVSQVKSFREKPDQKTAEGYIACGALWNAGVFGFRVFYIVAKAKELTHCSCYNDLFNTYGQQKKVSFDYAVSEGEKSIQVLRYSGRWADLGTWNTLTEIMEDKVSGNVIIDDHCDGTRIINRQRIPLLCTGIKNAVIVASAEGILIAEKEASMDIKAYVDQLAESKTCGEKETLLDSCGTSVVVRVDMGIGEHQLKGLGSIWTVVSGIGVVGNEEKLTPGVVLHVTENELPIVAETEMVFSCIRFDKV